MLKALGTRQWSGDRLSVSRAGELVDADGRIKDARLEDRIKDFMRGFRYDAHPMAILMGVVGASSSFYHDSLDIKDPRHREISAHRMIAKMPTIAAWSYKYAFGQPFLYPDDSLGYVENFLRMMFAVPARDYEPERGVVQTLNLLLIVNADYKQNCGTETERTVASSAFAL